MDSQLVLDAKILIAAIQVSQHCVQGHGSHTNGNSYLRQAIIVSKSGIVGWLDRQRNKIEARGPVVKYYNLVKVPSTTG